MNQDVCEFLLDSAAQRRIEVNRLFHCRRKISWSSAASIAIAAERFLGE